MIYLPSMRKVSDTTGIINSRNPKKNRKYNWQKKKCNIYKLGMELGGITFYMHHIHQRGIYVDEMLTQRRKYERYGIDCHRLNVEYWEGGIFVLTADRQYQLFCMQGTWNTPNTGHSLMSRT